MSIKDIYTSTVYTFDVIKTPVDAIVRLEPREHRMSLIHDNNGKYEDLITGKILDNPEHRIISGVIFANNNEVDENKEYILAEYLYSFKTYTELTKLDVKEQLTKEELFEIINKEEFLSKILKEEVKNEKSIWIRF